MKVLLLTVAGLSARFGKSVGHECLKCIYFEKDYKETLLWKAVNKDSSFDKIIIVGGYKFDELSGFIQKYLKDFSKKIELVNNEKFAKYGSGYSLYKGLENAIELSPEQLVFAEGDLWVDDESFSRISNLQSDCVTYNFDEIKADKAVVFYFDKAGKIHYLYDTAHNALEIKEPFVSIYNSGQIWKFSNFDKLKRTFLKLPEDDWKTTNLVFIQQYFGGDENDGYSLLPIKQWLNCNTVHDFKKIGIYDEND